MPRKYAFVLLLLLSCPTKVLMYNRPKLAILIAKAAERYER